MVSIWSAGGVIPGPPCLKHPFCSSGPASQQNMGCGGLETGKGLQQDVSGHPESPGGRPCWLSGWRLDLGCGVLCRKNSFNVPFGQGC